MNKEKETIEAKLNEQIKKETVLEIEKVELENRQAQALKELEYRLKAEEEEKLKLVEVWKVELEKERNKPWWKKIFG